VLIAEDDAEFLQLLEEYFERHGLAVVTARDGKRALRLGEVVQPDVVVTDMVMPELDGFGLISEYRARNGGAPPIIAMSSFQAYAEQALELGAVSALRKPFDLGDLVSSVRCVLEHKTPAPLRHGVEDSDREAARILSILDLNLDERAPEPELNAFIESVAEYFGVPVALLSVVTEDRQFWSAACGLPDDLERSRGTHRRDSFCAHAVVARAALIVQDASKNPVFKDNNLVTQRGLRFYAGVPLIARHGEALGTLCLLDFVPRTFTHFDLELLSVFARQVMAALEWRERVTLPHTPDSVFRYLQNIDKELEVFGKEAFETLVIAEGARAAEAQRQASCVVLAVPEKRLKQAVSELRERHVRSFVGRLGQSRLGWLTPNWSAEDARNAALEIGGPHAFAEAAELGQYPGAAHRTIQELETSLGDAGLA
jgi:DNA-binding response OmpR family regulator